MASEKDFELLDDYLSNRLSEQDKASFEEQIQSDPDLKRELDFQQNLVEGIRQARITQLKGMLNNIPVSTIPSGQTSLVAKIGSAVVIGGIVITGIYWYLSGNTETATEPVETNTETAEVEPAISEETETTLSADTIAAEVQDETTASVEQPEAAPVVKPKRPVKKPALQVFDPTTAEEQPGLDPQEQIDIISHAFVTSSMEVVTDADDKDYSFHYMFKDKKLMLYGIQEDDLYEILEFIYDEKRTVFLFYKTNYYWLDVSKDEPTKLAPIRDRKLLNKLKEYRGN